MMVAARGDECGLRAEALHELETEHAGVEAERTLEICDLQMNVPDADSRIDRRTS